MHWLGHSKELDSRLLSMTFEQNLWRVSQILRVQH